MLSLGLKEVHSIFCSVRSHAFRWRLERDPESEGDHLNLNQSVLLRAVLGTIPQS